MMILSTVFNVFKHPFYSSSAVVSSETPYASLIGLKTLLNGGNAVDAAVATSLALAITVPHLGGLGGDFFALVMNPNGKVSFINGSGYAPAKLTPELLKSRGLSKVPLEGPLSAVVPGMIDGLRVMWEKFGSLEWPKIVDLVINSLNQGFPLSNSLASALNNLKDVLSKDLGSKETYYKVKDSYQAGDLIKFDGMIKTLKMIKEDPRVFYEGDIALKLSEYVESVGGVISYDDMRKYKAEIGTPIKIHLEGRDIYEMPPNTQGITTLHLLMLLSREESFKNSRSAERVSSYLKAFKIAYSIRDSFIGDLRYMNVSLDELLSEEFLSRHRDDIIKLNQVKGDGDTTYFTVVDSEGTVVSGIQSLFYPFGSKVTEPTYGITLNCRASSFVLNVNHPNSLAPHKKPLHTLSAMIVVDTETNRTLSLGLSGGHFRPQLHAEIYFNIFKYGLNTQEAIEHPRFVWHIGSDLIEFEEGFEEVRIEGVKTSKVKYPSRLGVSAAAEILPNKVRVAYSDIRGDGLPLGVV